MTAPLRPDAALVFVSVPAFLARLAGTLVTFGAYAPNNQDGQNLRGNVFSALFGNVTGAIK